MSIALEKLMIKKYVMSSKELINNRTHKLHFMPLCVFVLK